MRKQKIMSLANLAKINKMLEEGWKIDYSLSNSHVVLFFIIEPYNERAVGLETATLQRG